MSSEKAVRVKGPTLREKTEVWKALQKTFNLAYGDLTPAEARRVRKVVKLAGLACGQVKPTEVVEEEMFK